MKSTKNLAFIALIAFFVFACSNSENKKKASELDNLSSDMLDESIQNIPVPNSHAMMLLINEAGIGYVFEITNPVENIDRYLSTKNKAINLGVYASDLSYNAVYQKKAETQAYLSNMLQLAEDMNIGVDAKSLSQRFESNIDQKDSLSSIVKDLVEKSQDILNQTSQNEIALCFLTGSWIESVYLTGVITNFSDDKKVLCQIILKHYDYLNLLLKYLEEKKDLEDFKELFLKLTALKPLFEELKAQPDNKEKMENLKAKITELRNNII
jgi:hypothetical protein